jgi:hypothetical protein
MEAASTRTPRPLGSTSRKDAWWIWPALVAFGLLAFGVYALVVALAGDDYLYEGGGAYYLSPFYSPDLESMLGVDPPFSPAFLVLWVPLGLRATCYYYRKAYYRSFFLAPPACAVAGARRKRYRGETGLLVLQNAHRYFFYVATIVLGFLWYDAFRAFVFESEGEGHELGVGVGSLVLLGNVVLLSAFTFGCNSFRHLVGGQLDCFTCSRTARTRHTLWRGVTVLHLRHREWAWLSLASVALADLYVRLAATGAFDDPRIV